MSLNRILKRFKELEQQQQQIQLKFSTHSKSTNIYRKDLKKDEQDDHRIFGFTHNDTIELFKSLHNKSRQRNTAFEDKIEDQFFSSNQIEQQKRRTKTLHDKKKQSKSLSRSRPPTCKVYFMPNDYFYKKINTASFQKSAQNTTCTTNLFCRTKQSQHNFNEFHQKDPLKKMAKKSIYKYKKQFASNFIQNIKSLKDLNSNKREPYRKTLVVYQIEKLRDKVNNQVSPQSLQPQYKTKSQMNEFFKLTSLVVQKNNIFMGQLGDNIQKYRNYSWVIMSKDVLDLNFCKLRQCAINKWKPLWQIKNFQQIKGQQILIIIFQINSLKSLFIQNLSIKKDYFETSDGKIVDLEKIIRILFLNPTYSLLHITIIKKKQIIIQQFISRKDLIAKNSQFNKTLLLNYYLKKFLYLDNNVSVVQDVVKNANLIINGTQNIPKEFIEFLQEIPNRIIYFYDRNAKLLNYYSKDLLNVALVDLIAFQAETKRLVISSYGLKTFKRNNIMIQSKKKFFFCLLIQEIQELEIFLIKCFNNIGII